MVLRVGAARVDITPPAPVPLAGYPPIHVTPEGPQDHRGYTPRTGCHEGVHDPVHARALAVEEGEQRALVVSLDVCHVTLAFTDRVRAAAAQRWGAPPDGILVAATHNHSGPDFEGQWEAVDQATTDFVCEATVDAIGQALARLQPARLGLGLGEAGQLITNRRDRSRPVDPRIPVLRMEDMDGATLAILYSFACHPIIAGSEVRQVTAEYPGVAASIVEAALGGVCLFLNGAAGNVNPVAFPYRCGENVVTVRRQLARTQPLDPRRSLAEVRRFGCVLGAEVLRVAAATETSPAGGIRSARRRVAAALKAPAAMDEFLTHVSYAPAFADIWRGCSHYETEVSALRLGPLTLLALPGEPFAELGLELEAGGHGPGYLRVVGYANDLSAYLVPPSQYSENRYETVATPLSPSGTQAIMTAAADVRDEIGTT